MKIALLSALPAGLNTGMLTVEYAFKSIQNEKNWIVNRYCLERDFSFEHQYLGEINATKIENSDLLEEYDRIIYWGDFLHWRGYLHKDLYLRHQKLNSEESFDKTIERYYDIFFLEKKKKLLKKSIAFGGTIYPLSTSDLKDERYRNNLQNLLTNARSVKFRDVYSSELARGIINSEKSFMGVDPAFLLDTKSINTHQHKNKYLVFSFGRSGHNEFLAKIAIMISKKLGLDAYDLQWFALQNGQNPLIKKLEVLKGASLVITDIYHMSINAFREGKLTYMFGNGASYAMSSLSDKKKEILFKQYLVEPQYLYTELVKNEKYLNSVIDSIAQRLNENTGFQNEYLEQQISYARTMLIKNIEK